MEISIPGNCMITRKQSWGRAMFKSILVPIDVAHSSSWRHALPEAIDLMAEEGSVLTVVTVIREVTAIFEGVYLTFQLERMVQDARQKLAEIVFPYSGKITIHQHVRVGSIGSEILDVALDARADLIVMASHRPEMMDYLIGPNAAHVAQHASCSVLVLRKFDR